MSEPAAAFRATFSDWKLVKSRKVVQLVFEVPMEGADYAYQVLGGMPNPAAEVWCAVARLNEKGGELASNHDPRPADTTPRPQPDKPAGGAKRSWHELTPAQQAGIRCNEPPFWLFLSENRSGWTEVKNANEAAAVVRKWCQIESRTELNTDAVAATHWRELDTSYRVWQEEPAVVG
jgi:hypothetical protein